MGYIGAGVTRFNTADELTVTGDAQIDTTTLVVDSTNNRVGIRTASPTADLHISYGSGSGLLVEDTTNSPSVKSVVTSGNTESYFGATSNHPLVFLQNNTERMRIDNSGNVGIGTASVDNKLHLENAGSLYLQIENTSTANKFYLGNSSGNAILQSTGAYSMNFITNGSERMRIASGGNVGIGTTSPLRDLHVSNGGAEGYEFGPGETANKNQTLHYNRSTSQYVENSNRASQHTWDVGSSEAARIDSSQNLLVGKTSQGLANVGFEASSAGNVQITRSAATPLVLNRLSSDGDIVSFRKDGSTVGLIGVADSGDRIYLAGPGLEGVGIDNSANAFVPTSEAGAFKDNHLSLGQSGARFENLYLSGGAYLGGTAAANQLDDYEEGTWTPAYAAASGTITSHSNSSGFYTKVGRMVYIQGYVSYQSDSSASGTITVTGLPFTSRSTGYGQSQNQAGGVASYVNALFSSNSPDGGRIPNNATLIMPFVNNATGASQLQYSDFSTSANHSQFVFFGHYFI